MRHRQSLALMSFCTLVAAGCAPKATPIAPGVTFQPDEKEQRLWRAGEKDAAILRSKGILLEDPALHEYVNSVMGRLLKPSREAYAPLTCRVYIINSAVVNAFALPQGDIFLHAGILGRIRSEAQLAMLLGHEITHSTHRHSYLEREDAYARLATASYVSVLSAVGGGNVSKTVSKLSWLVTQAGVSGYSRDKEREADSEGLRLIARAGYDPAEGARLFQNMLEAADPKELQYNALYATHPKMKERVADCTALARELPAELLNDAKETGADRYANAAAFLIHEDMERQIARGKYELAESTVRFLLAQRPGDAIAHAYQGEICRARGRKEDAVEAREAYLKAIELDAGQPVALRGLGFLCVKQGAKADAVRYLEAYLAADQDARDAAYVRQTIERLKQQ